MKNSEKQKRTIEKQLFARWTHSEKTIEEMFKNVETRRKYRARILHYKGDIVAEKLSDPALLRALRQAHKSYQINARKPPSKQDDTVMHPKS